MHVLRFGGEYLESRESRSWMALVIIGLAIVLIAMVGALYERSSVGFERRGKGG
jgi:hypothetical protein